MSVVACFHAVTETQLATFLKDPSALVAFLESDQPKANSINIDQAADGIQYLLSQHNCPEANTAVLGGTKTATEVGYGPVRYLRVAEVSAIARGLSSISEEQLGEHFSPEEMQEACIEPNPDWFWEDEDSLDYLLKNYLKLVEFYQKAASEKNAVLQYET
jgi:hypothetical protein